MRTILFLTAHADDMELGAGGACAILRKKGYDVHVIVATEEANAATAERRRHEAISAATILGVSRGNVHFLGLPDGSVACNPGTVAALRGLTSKLYIKPDAIFTHSLVDSHQDHVEIARLARAAFRGVALFRFLVRNSAILSHFRPSVYCTIDNVIGAKEAALLEHRSQVALGRICLDKVREFTGKFSGICAGKYCEAFELEIQNNAPCVDALIEDLDGAPFTRLWSPLLATSKLTILAGGNEAGRRRGEVSEAVFLTRLQARLMSTVRARLDDGPFYQFEVVDFPETPGTAIAEQGHLLVLGLPGMGATSSCLFDGFSGNGFVPQRLRHVEASHVGGLLSVAPNPFSRLDGTPSFVFIASGPDHNAIMAAAMVLLDDARLSREIERILEVISGRMPMVQIEALPSAPHSSRALDDINRYAIPGIVKHGAGR